MSLVLPVELQGLAPFALLPQRALADIALVARIHSCRGGERLFHAGEACTGAMLLLRGIVRLTRAGATGRDRTVAIVRPGGLLTLAALRGETTFENSAEAIIAARAVELPTAQISALAERHPILLTRVVTAVLMRLEDGYGDALLGTPGPLPERLLRLLRRVATPAGGPGMGACALRLPTGLSHAELARVLGADRASVTRALQRLEAKGLIERSHGHVVSVMAASPQRRAGRMG